MGALVAKYGKQPRRLYYQPAALGRQENRHEAPTTALQNYVILAFGLATQSRGVRLVQETDMLAPLADLINLEAAGGGRAKSLEGGGGIDTASLNARERRRALVRDLQNPRLFEVTIVQMLRGLCGSASRRFGPDRMRRFLDEGGSLMRVMRGLESSGSVSGQELALLREGLAACRKRMGGGGGEDKKVNGKHLDSSEKGKKRKEGGGGGAATAAAAAAISNGSPEKKKGKEAAAAAAAATSPILNGGGGGGAAEE